MNRHSQTQSVWLMQSTSIFLIGFAWLFALPAAKASPTSDDFKSCHVMAAEILKACLDQHAGYADDDACWHEAHQSKIKCYADVQRTYAPSTHASQRKAEEEAWAKRFDNSGGDSRYDKK